MRGLLVLISNRISLFSSAPMHQNHIIIITQTFVSMLKSSRIVSNTSDILSPVWEPVKRLQVRSRDIKPYFPDFGFTPMMCAVTPRKLLIVRSDQMSAVSDTVSWVARRLITSLLLDASIDGSLTLDKVDRERIVYLEGRTNTVQTFKLLKIYFCVFFITTSWGTVNNLKVMEK